MGINRSGVESPRGGGIPPISQPALGMGGRLSHLRGDLGNAAYGLATHLGDLGGGD